MRCCGIKVLHARCYCSGGRMPGGSILRSVRAVFVAISYARRRRSARFRVELYFRVLICSEILRRAMALNSILREILEF